MPFTPLPDLDSFVAAVSFGPDGLVPVIAQQRSTGDVLMLAWMDEAALRETCATGLATYFSRSRASRWVKGETSGHFQHVHDIRMDCDADTLLLAVDQVGVACHTGDSTCFDCVGAR